LRFSETSRHVHEEFVHGSCDVEGLIEAAVMLETLFEGFAKFLDGSVRVLAVFHEHASEFFSRFRGLVGGFLRSSSMGASLTLAPFTLLERGLDQGGFAQHAWMSEMLEEMLAGSDR